MILVDSSVWIDYFRSADTPQVALLDSCFGRTRIAVGDLIAAEVLQGIRDNRPRCIEDGLTLLHSDRDFAPFAKHLGLREAYTQG